MRHWCHRSSNSIEVPSEKHSIVSRAEGRLMNDVESNPLGYRQAAAAVLELRRPIYFEDKINVSKPCIKFHQVLVFHCALVD